MFSVYENRMAGNAREEYIHVEPNVRLHVTDAGEGVPIVLLHGWPLSDRMFEYQYNELISRDFRVIGITFRGFGESDKPYGEYGYDIHADDIRKVLEHLNISGAILVGFSMGGSVAIRFAAEYNSSHVSKLVLCGAAAPIWTQRKDFPYNLTKKEVDDMIEMNYHDRPMLLSNFVKIFSANENLLSEGIKNWLYEIGLTASSHAMGECLIALRDTDLREDLKKIELQTLILHGKQDKICSFDLAGQMHEAIKNSILIPFENSGHSLFLDETPKFNDELIRFANEYNPYNFVESNNSIFKAAY